MQNAFSERLSPHRFDVFDIPAVDVLHEVEIGVWKSLFIHLLRLLETIPGTGQETVLNSRFVSPVYSLPSLRLLKLKFPPCRFCQIPAFGQDTIQRFQHDVSAMKQFRVRDFEDLLQVRVPKYLAPSRISLSPSVLQPPSKVSFLPATTTGSKICYLRSPSGTRWRSCRCIRILLWSF